MSMKLKRTRKIGTVILTTSMANMIFLLTIFFMLTTTFDLDRTQINLPLSMKRSNVERGSAYIIISRLVSGSHESIIYKFSNGDRMSLPVNGYQDLYVLISNLAYSDPGRPFVIKADKDIKYARVDEVLDLCRRAGATNLLLMTQQKTVDYEGL